MEGHVAAAKKIGSRPATVDPLQPHRERAARLIFSELWQGQQPPPPAGARSWSMRSELGVWTRLVRSGIDPRALNGALSVVRRVENYDGPMRMTWFRSHKYGSPLLERCIHHWQQGLPRRGRTPPTIQHVLRAMIDA